jgi:hypothetical protein
MYALTKNSWENPFGETLGKVRPALSLSLSRRERREKRETPPPASLSLPPTPAQAGANLAMGIKPVAQSPPGPLGRLIPPRR